MSEQDKYQVAGYPSQIQDPGMGMAKPYTGALGALLSPLPGPKVCAALVKAQKTAKAVGKDARNSHHGYSYASSEAIIEEARAALAEAELAVFPVCHDRDPNKPDHSWIGEGDGAFIDAPRRVKTIYLLIHESGETMRFESTAPVIPEKGRPEDKAEFGARTENLAYALRDLLLLPRVDVETPSGRDDRDKPLRGQPPVKPSSQPMSKQMSPRQESVPPKAQEASSPATPAAAATLPASKTLRPSIPASSSASAANAPVIEREPEPITAEQDTEIGALFKKAKMSRVAVTEWITREINPKGPSYLTRADGDIVIEKLKAMLEKV